MRRNTELLDEKVLGRWENEVVQLRYDHDTDGVYVHHFDVTHTLNHEKGDFARFEDAIIYFQDIEQHFSDHHWDHQIKIEQYHSD